MLCAEIMVGIRHAAGRVNRSGDSSYIVKHVICFKTLGIGVVLVTIVITQLTTMLLIQRV